MDTDKWSMEKSKHIPAFKFGKRENARVRTNTVVHRTRNGDDIRDKETGHSYVPQILRKVQIIRRHT